MYMHIDFDTVSTSKMLGACTTSPSRQILVVPMRAPRLPIGLSGIGLANRT